MSERKSKREDREGTGWVKEEKGVEGTKGERGKRALRKKKLRRRF